jgi:uncharacterized membrane protein YccF (DUF307 family)
MRLLGNILWFVLAGFWLALGYVFTGLVLCVFIITIPFGVQAFKLAGFVLWPFGKAIVAGDGADGPLRILANLLWLVFGGFGLVVSHLVLGLVLCITIIGIPFGLANFRMAVLALWPFGRRVVSAELAAAMAVRPVMVVPPLGPPS